MSLQSLLKTLQDDLGKKQEKIETLLSETEKQEHKVITLSSQISELNLKIITLSKSHESELEVLNAEIERLKFENQDSHEKVIIRI